MWLDVLYKATGMENQSAPISYYSAAAYSKYTLCFIHVVPFLVFFPYLKKKLNKIQDSIEYL